MAMSDGPGDGPGDGPTEPGALLDELRAATARRVQELVATFDDIVEAASDVATDDEHDPEGHTIAWERQQVAALLRDARAELAEVEAALRRLDDGSYGRCATCGDRIASARLQALPAATTCIRCAT